MGKAKIHIRGDLHEKEFAVLEETIGTLTTAVWEAVDQYFSSHRIWKALGEEYPIVINTKDIDEGIIMVESYWDEGKDSINLDKESAVLLAETLMATVPLMPDEAYEPIPEISVENPLARDLQLANEESHQLYNLVRLARESEAAKPGTRANAMVAAYDKVIDWVRADPKKRHAELKALDPEWNGTVER